MRRIKIFVGLKIKSKNNNGWSRITNIDGDDISYERWFGRVRSYAGNEKRPSGYIDLDTDDWFVDNNSEITLLLNKYLK